MGIGKRLVKEMKPKSLRVGDYWYPRGGMVTGQLKVRGISLNVPLFLMTILAIARLR